MNGHDDALGFDRSHEQPNSRQIQKLLERTIRDLRSKRQTITCDRGVQFDYLRDVREGE